MKWLNSKDHGLWPTLREVEFARKAWDAAIESTKEKQFGCHIGCGNPYPDCVIDTGDIAECGTAMDLDSLGKTKIDCEYWKVIEG